MKEKKSAVNRFVESGFVTEELFEELIVDLYAGRALLLQQGFSLLEAVFSIFRSGRDLALLCPGDISDLQQTLHTALYNATSFRKGKQRTRGVRAVAIEDSDSFSRVGRLISKMTAVRALFREIGAPYQRIPVPQSKRPSPFSPAMAQLRDQPPPPDKVFQGDLRQILMNAEEAGVIRLRRDSASLASHAPPPMPVWHSPPPLPSPGLPIIRSYVPLATSISAPANSESIGPQTISPPLAPMAPMAPTQADAVRLSLESADSTADESTPIVTMPPTAPPSSPSPPWVPSPGASSSDSDCEGGVATLDSVTSCGFTPTSMNDMTPGGGFNLGLGDFACDSTPGDLAPSGDFTPGDSDNNDFCGFTSTPSGDFTLSPGGFTPGDSDDDSTSWSLPDAPFAATLPRCISPPPLYPDDPLFTSPTDPFAFDTPGFPPPLGDDWLASTAGDLTVPARVLRA
ncbi:hypothetical protein PAPYR_6311 [Paratrimastix pyriformis]|uniref:Uncharacterized protein n=1 Tax=Paratrimastix pyriformis TaxID=342808 RepID=A0ABQ8UI22_9EUKA|nr:hypothetical protein PAPYR_6311 [Paratrimastix pyriformis]